MGDRATLVLIPNQPARLVDEPQCLYLYVHWHGSDLPQRVAQGLWDGRPRWGEPAYMARILVCSVLGDDLHEIDGFGLSLSPYGHPADAGRPQLVVDLRSRRVGFVAWDKHAWREPLPWDYDAFIGEARWP